MNSKTKLILALQQIENIRELVKGNQWEGFFSSHLLPLKYEFERQLNLLTNFEQSTKIKE
jgi:hypothetical protein